MMKAPSLIVRLLAVLTLLAAPGAARTEAQIPADMLKRDLSAWRDWMFATHPDPSFSMDVDAIEAEFETVANDLLGQYTRRQAWRAFAVINPDFRDGHVAIRPPQQDYEAYLEAGGADFSLPVTVRDGRLFVADSLQSSSSVYAGAEILSINDEPARELTSAALARIHGDTRALREFIFQERTSLYLWALTGGAAFWEIETQTATGARERHRLDPLTDRAATNGDYWRLRLDGDAAILTLDTFRAEYETEFAAFIESAFEQIAQADSTVLVIDISHNGGGARQLSDRLFAYLTHTRYTPISAVTARITPQNQALVPGSEIGQVLSLPFAQWVEPPEELAHRFTGKVAFLIGTGTYSQAIVTASIAQDFRIAAVAGTPTAGRANSTGQVQTHTLSQSGLQVGAPIYVFTRASGDQSTDPVIPDIPLAGSREEQVEALITHLRSSE